MRSELAILEDSSGTGDFSQIAPAARESGEERRSPEETRKEIWRVSVVTGQPGVVSQAEDDGGSGTTGPSGKLWMMHSHTYVNPEW